MTTHGSSRCTVQNTLVTGHCRFDSFARCVLRGMLFWVPRCTRSTQCKALWQIRQTVRLAVVESHTGIT